MGLNIELKLMTNKLAKYQQCNTIRRNHNDLPSLDIGNKQTPVSERPYIIILVHIYTIIQGKFILFIW